MRKELNQELYKCVVCNKDYHWEGDSNETSTIYYCESCNDNYVCSDCISSYDENARNCGIGELDEILCPDCYNKKHEA
jgi:DNA-directed RNA polymerase subunit RPC12/RpoP